MSQPTAEQRAQYVREKLSSFRRELENAVTPYKIKECLHDLSDALEVLLYGQLVEPSPAHIPGAPLKVDENKTRVEIFMPGQPGNPAGPAPVTSAMFQVAPAAPPAALPPVQVVPAPSSSPTFPVATGGDSVDAQAARALAEIARITGAGASAPTPLPAAAPVASTPQAAAVVSPSAIDEAARIAAENAARIAAGSGPSDRHVEIFMPGDPNAPKPAQVG